MLGGAKLSCELCRLPLNSNVVVNNVSSSSVFCHSGSFYIFKGTVNMTIIRGTYNVLCIYIFDKKKSFDQCEI